MARMFRIALFISVPPPVGVSGMRDAAKHFIQPALLGVQFLNVPALRRRANLARERPVRHGRSGKRPGQHHAVFLLQNYRFLDAVDLVEL